MSDEVLSQEEIEALIAQTAGDGATAQPAAGEPASAQAAPAAEAPVVQSAPAPSPEPVPSTPPEVNVRPVEFSPVGATAGGAARNGVDLILDVQLQVTVELGRASMLVKDVLGLGPGSVVELDRYAGEPVDVVVNNKTIARGEVVVIDENFGVRVTEIVRGNERDARARAA